MSFLLACDGVERVAMSGRPADLATLSVGLTPELINGPAPPLFLADAAVKLDAHAHFWSSFSWKVSVAWRVVLPWGGNQGT